MFKQNLLKRLLVIWALVLISSSIWAREAQNALLETVDGEVLLYQNDRYVPVKSGQRVSDGDRLMIMENSSVKVIFDNGCEVTWDGAMLADVKIENCPTVAGLWIPCVGAIGAGLDGEKIILTQIDGSVLVQRNGEYLKGEEGMELEEGDVLKIDGMAEVNYRQACTTVHEGLDQLVIDKNLCPIAVLSEVEGKALVKDGERVLPATQGLELKNLTEIDVSEDSKVKITYFNGCDETWEGKDLVRVDAERCPVVAAVPTPNCSPAVLGSLTTAGVSTVGAGIVVVGTLIPRGDDNNPPPPVSP